MMTTLPTSSWKKPLAPQNRSGSVPLEPSFFRALSGSAGLHFFVLLIIVFLSWLFHVKTIEELMKEGGSIALSGPAPEETLDVTLAPDLPPPPPADHPEFIQQILKPPVIPSPEPPKPKPQTQPIKRPAYTAPKATGSGESAASSQLVIGTSGFPKPPYPYEAKRDHTEGTVILQIAFGPSGRPEVVDLVTSSGSRELDSSARTFIRDNWQDPSFAGHTVTVPINYVLAH